MNIFVTWYFVKEVRALAKAKYKRVYGNVLKDLGSFLNEADSMDRVLKLGDVVASLNYRDHKKPTKARVNNSTTKSGKPAGYRLILFALDEQDALILVSIYPKTGPYGKPKPSQQDWEELLEDYQDAHAENSFYEALIIDGELQIQIDEEDEEHEE